MSKTNYHKFTREQLETWDKEIRHAAFPLKMHPKFTHTKIPTKHIIIVDDGVTPKVIHGEIKSIIYAISRL